MPSHLHVVEWSTYQIHHVSRFAIGILNGQFQTDPDFTVVPFDQEGSSVVDAILDSVYLGKNLTDRMSIWKAWSDSFGQYGEEPKPFNFFEWVDFSPSTDSDAVSSMMNSLILPLDDLPDLDDLDF